MNGLRTRRRWARLAVVAVAAVAATGIASTTAVAAPVAVTGGTITWGVKESFRSYVTGPIAHGSITIGGGASGSGVYSFPVGSGSRDAAASTASAQSSGSVRFVGHDEILEVALSNIRVNVNGNSGTIVADMQYRPFTNTTTQNPLETASAVSLATLDLSGVTPSNGANSVTFTNVPATLTAAGADAFGGFYPAGTGLDPVSFTLALSESPGPDPDPDPSPGVTSGGMRWVVSEQIWGQTSLNQCRAAVAPATVVAGAWNDPAAGVVFPTASGTYDSATGAGSLELDGGLVIGNYAQGNYRLRLTDLTVTIAANGAGTLTADVEYSLSPGGAPPANCDDTRAWTAAGDDVTVVTFTADPADRNTVGNSVYWTVTPPWATADPQYSFAPSFVSALPSTLQGHFQATGNPVDPNGAANLRKPPAPMYLQFGLATVNPTATIEISATLVDQGALTISVADTNVTMTNLALAPNGQRYEATGQLSQVTVTDTRPTNPGWSVSAQITNFTGPGGTFPAAGLGWTPALVSSGDGQTVDLGAAVAPGVGLDGKTLASTAAGSGRGTAVVGAALRLHAPTSIAAGTYTATMTVTAI